MTQEPIFNPQEPIFNITERAPVILGAVFIGLHIAIYYGPDFIESFAAFWGVLKAWNMAGQTQLSRATAVLGHGFIHGSWTHVLLNTAMMVPFGVVTIKGAKILQAQKGRASRGLFAFLFIFIAGVIIGAAGQLLQWNIAKDAGGMAVGASGGVSALFASGAWAMGGRPQLLRFGAAWIVINIILIYAGSTLTGGAGIAWASHLAGFAAGAVLAPLLVRAKSTGLKSVTG